jgi:DNA-directed RNA polymerase sigma subunit (sigma70/sigma32)
MKCPVCGRPTRVLEAEPFGGIGQRVSRQCTAPTSHAHDGAVFTMYEVPETAARAIGMSRLHSAMQVAMRGIEQRRVAVERRRQALVLMRRGKSVSQVARDLGVTGARVRQYLAGQ